MSAQPEAQSALKAAAKPGKSARQKQSASKADLVLRALRRKSGVSLDELCKLTGWQAHSVRGFLSGTVRKKLGYEVIRHQDAKGVTRYSMGKSEADS
ncbi:MAG: DUF3489 domain-containing protein [Anderseniella sp.]|jgi:hypothetical protein|nr:DUF3489 domain-containing protein [Anderseniella sp.]